MGSGGRTNGVRNAMRRQRFGGLSPAARRSMRRSMGIPLLLVAACALGRADVRAEGLRVGAADVVITPPVGAPMAGYYSRRASEGVHDDLHAKALVIEVGGAKSALVALDRISTTRDLV